AGVAPLPLAVAGESGSRARRTPPNLGQPLGAHPGARPRGALGGALRALSPSRSGSGSVAATRGDRWARARVRGEYPARCRTLSRTPEPPPYAGTVAQPPRHVG